MTGVANPFDLKVVSAGLTNATYASGDQLGTEITCTTGGVASCLAVVTAITIVDYIKVIGALDVRIFSAATTPATDNAAASWSDADMLNAVAGGLVSLPTPTSETNNSVTAQNNLLIGPFVCNGSGAFFVDLITRTANAAYTDATGLKVRIAGFYYS